MNLVYNTVFTPIRATSIRGKLVHNTHVQQIETTQISGNEFWSFAKKKNRNTVSDNNKSKRTAGNE